MFYFNDVQLWERQEKIKRDVEPVRVFSNLLLAKDDRPVCHAYDGSAESEPLYGDVKSVVEVLQRVTVLVERHWYVLDVHLKGPNSNILLKAAEHSDFMQWLPFHPSRNELVEMIIKDRPASGMAPAPFCCIERGDFYRKSWDPTSAAGAKKPYEARWQIPQELFFHRMYVNMSTQFVNRTALHSALKRYFLARLCSLHVCRC